MSKEPSSISSADCPLSLIVPTKDRSFFLERFLRFHASAHLSCPIHIGDASEDPKELARNEELVTRYEGSLRLDYERHLPGITTVASVHQLLKKIATAYTVFCGDDDYLIPRQLQRCVQFLESHPDYASVTGDQAEVFVESDGNGGLAVKEIVPGAHKDASHPRASLRLLQWATPAIGKNTFSVQPTEILRWSWRETAPLGLDIKLYAPLHELSVNVLTLLRGKQKHLRGLYHVMLRHTQKTGFSGPIDYFERIARWDWPAKVTPTLERWTREIVRSDPIPEEAARRVAQTVFLQWLLPYLARNRDRKLRDAGLPVAAGRSAQQRLSRIGLLKTTVDFLRGTHRQAREIHAVLREGA